MELLPTSKSSSDNNGTTRRFKRASSMPLILTRLVRFPQMDFEVPFDVTVDHSFINLNYSLLFGKWLTY